MPSIVLRNVGIDFPIYSSRGRSLRSNMFRRVGGHLEQKDGDIVVVQALRDINLTLKPGDRLALIGHNGAGKSTLLRALSGAYEPTTGEIEIEGRVQSLLDLTMGMDPELTGRENIVLRGVFLGLTFAEINRLMPSIEEFTELGDFLQLPLRTYSSGMTLRLAFAVSTAIAPDIILMDELISVGDANFRERARDRLESMIQSSGILVLASHNANVLKQYCNRAILLREGRIAAEGTVEDVLAIHREQQQAPAGARTAS